jgi:hypothetical protein
MPGCKALEDILVLALDEINYIKHRSFVIDKTPNLTWSAIGSRAAFNTHKAGN